MSFQPKYVRRPKLVTCRCLEASQPAIFERTWLQGHRFYVDFRVGATITRSRAHAYEMHNEGTNV